MSSMPVRIVFKDQNDLTPPARQELLTYLRTGTTDDNNNNLNIDFVDLSTFFNLDAADLKGWNLKPFGMLAVPETQVAFLDVDVVLLQPPEALFASALFQKTGALFYHDRLKPELAWNPRVLAQGLQPNLSPKARHQLLEHGSFYTEHVQESGVLLLDKQRRYLGLWSSCLLLGREDIRKHAHNDHQYGDKETYWMAFETIGEPYEFARWYPGVVGGILTDFRGGGDVVATIHQQQDGIQVQQKPELEESKTADMALCGRLLHFDDDGQPLWANGGYLTKDEDYASKSSDMSELELQPVWYLDGGDATTEQFPTVHPILWYTLYNMRGMNQNWKVHSGIGVECISPNARNRRRVPDTSAKLTIQAVKNYVDLLSSDRNPHQSE